MMFSSFAQLNDEVALKKWHASNGILHDKRMRTWTRFRVTIGHSMHSESPRFFIIPATLGCLCEMYLRVEADLLQALVLHAKQIPLLAVLSLDVEIQDLPYMSSSRPHDILSTKSEKKTLMTSSKRLPQAVSFSMLMLPSLRGHPLLNTLSYNSNRHPKQSRHFRDHH